MASGKHTQQISMNLGSTGVSFDPDAFDLLIRTQGVLWEHWAGMRCPTGMVDRDDLRRPHPHHENCSNGFLYQCVGKVTGSFLGNSHNRTQEDVGWMDGSTIEVSLPRYYEDSSESISVCQFDRFFIADSTIIVPHWQLVEHHATGKDRLSFPAVKVHQIVDANGVRYSQEDFCIVDGQIHWGNRRPGINPETGRGTIYTIRYSYRPYFYVSRINHEVRVSQVQDPITGERKVMRFPQSFVFVREHIFENEAKDPQIPSSPRQQLGPADGLYGPR